MLHELEPDAFASARPAFRQMDYNLAVNSIIEGTTRSRIFVDDPGNPRAAITWNNARVFLSGHPDDGAFNSSLRALFEETIFPQILSTGCDVAVLYFAPDAWEERMESLLGGREARKFLRHFYTIAELKQSFSTPEGFEIRPLDRELLDQAHLKNIDGLIEEMCSERSSVDAFLAHSFGFCALCKDELVGWCLSEYNSADRCEVGIETLEKFQRRGIGTAVAAALIEEAAGRQMTVGWHSYADNAPSVALAEKLCFKKVTEYSVCIIRLSAD